MPPTAFITWITGRDGSCLAEWLLAKGYVVQGLVRTPRSLARGNLAAPVGDESLPGTRPHLHVGACEDTANLRRVVSPFALQMVRIYRDTHRLPVSSLILYNHESPRHDEMFVSRKVIRAAARLGVVFTPMRLVSDEALVDRLIRAAVMLYASRPEPFGFAPLEANACGVPGVAVAELLGDPNRARALGENGRAWVADEWTWAACVDRLAAALRSTVERVSNGRNAP